MYIFHIFLETNTGQRITSSIGRKLESFFQYKAKQLKLSILAQAYSESNFDIYLQSEKPITPKIVETLKRSSSRYIIMRCLRIIPCCFFWDRVSLTSSDDFTGNDIALLCEAEILKKEKREQI